jgi:hypothetical protein
MAELHRIVFFSIPSRKWMAGCVRSYAFVGESKIHSPALAGWLAQPEWNMTATLRLIGV